MLGADRETMFLQHPWLLFAGVQGIERQHRMVCEFMAIAGTQFPACKSSSATAAIPKKSRLAIASTVGTSGTQVNQAGSGRSQCVSTVPKFYVFESTSKLAHERYRI